MFLKIQISPTFAKRRLLKRNAIKKMKTLGVDVATKLTGWSILEDNVLTNYGIIDGSKIKEVEHRLSLLYLNLYEIVEEYSPDIVAVEDQYFSRNMDTLKKLSQARGVVMLVASQLELPLYVITPSEAKLAICGKGNANKKEVREAVKQRYNIENIKEDEADAAAIAFAAITKHSRETIA